MRVINVYNRADLEFQIRQAIESGKNYLVVYTPSQSGTGHYHPGWTLFITD